jgi:hypothetical protein
MCISRLDFACKFLFMQMKCLGIVIVVECFFFECPTHQWLGNLVGAGAQKKSSVDYSYSMPRYVALYPLSWYILSFIYASQLNFELCFNYETLI